MRVRSPVDWTRTNNHCVRSAKFLMLLKPRTGFIFISALPIELPPVKIGTAVTYITSQAQQKKSLSSTRKAAFICCIGSRMLSCIHNTSYSGLFCLSDRGIVNKRFWNLPKRTVPFSLFLQITMVVICFYPFHQDTLSLNIISWLCESICMFCCKCP